MRSSSSLPPMLTLRAFEAVGRLMSFRGAGEELLVSQSAISHQILKLESFLGFKLFVRRARSISFTAEGERYFKVIGRSLDFIANETAEIKATRNPSRLQVSILPALAANWLVPRLSNFSNRYPEIKLILEPTLQLANLRTGNVDVALRYGNGKWPGCEARLLMNETLVPVASPDFLSRNPNVKHLSDILCMTMLSVAPDREWSIWGQANGLDISCARPTQLGDFNVAIQAALDGQGLLLGRKMLISELIKEGKLVEVCSDSAVEGKLAYWIVSAQGKAASFATNRFSDWLVNAALTCINKF